MKNFSILALIMFPFSLAKGNLNKHLSIEEVIKSSLEFYPKVNEALYIEEIKQNEEELNKGQFDAMLSSKLNSRTEGYYNGDFFESKLLKPLKKFNSKAYIGFRKSTGDFPVYDGKFLTQDGGEILAGFKLSLLRDREIDKNRFNLTKAKIAREIAKAKLKITKLEVRMLAEKAYWFWATRYYISEIYKELYNLSLLRKKALKKKAKAGAIAKIYLQENEQYIIKRELLYKESLVDLMQASQKLSLFYRDSNGHPIQIKQKPMKYDFNKFKSLVNSSQVERRSTIDNPLIQNLKRQSKINKEKIKIAKNQGLPKLDLNVEFSKDFGQSQKTLKESENRVFLNLEIPLQRRKVRSAIEIAKLEQKVTENRIRLLEDKISTDIRTTQEGVYKLKNILNLNHKESQLAKLLIKAEEKRVNLGESDFFVLNIREENYAKAKIKVSKTLYKLLFSLSKYNFLAARPL